MKANKGILGWIIIVLALCGLIFGFVYHIDPFFHYHKPYTDKFFYKLDNQRAQNDGIVRHFDYNAVISGTSMTENFKTSEMDALFGVKAIKIPYSGGAFKEVDTSVRKAIMANRDVKLVVRSLDIDYFLMDKDWERDDLGEFPEYLYDNNPFNDVEYVFNKDIIFDRAYNMVRESRGEGFKPGITSFDEYSYWQDSAVMGKESVCPKGVDIDRADQAVHLSDREREKVKETVCQNMITTADMFPNVEFYCFIPPYSMAWWADHAASGDVYRYVEAEEYAMELLTEHENIRLFSYNDRTDITGDLNNYMDLTHYGAWVSSLILEWMRDDKGRITRENYKDFVKKELENYLEYDYESLNTQEDHPDDAAYGEKIYKLYSDQEDND